jgi:hypothetical protein
MKLLICCGLVLIKFSIKGFAKFLTFAPQIINGSFTSYANQKVSSYKSNAGDLRLSTGGS